MFSAHMRQGAPLTTCICVWVAQITSSDPSVGQYGVQADKVLIAVGTSPARRSDIPFDGVRVLDRFGCTHGCLKFKRGC